MENSQKNLVDKSFVADMSTGFSGNLGYVIPDNWSFDQFYETSFTSTPTFDIETSFNISKYYAILEFIKQIIGIRCLKSKY